MSRDTTRSVLCLFPREVIPGLEEFRQRHILHPGRSVPFHVTLVYDFVPPQQLDEDALDALHEVARNTPQFQFVAKGLSVFPTSGTLYLTPSPMTPIERLTAQIHSRFPQYNPGTGYPIFHMTVALGGSAEQQQQAVTEYLESFGPNPLRLTAYRIGVCAPRGSEWDHCMSALLGPG